MHLNPWLTSSRGSGRCWSRTSSATICCASERCSRAWCWHGCCKMPRRMAVQVTIYLNEADQWHHRPLHMEILNSLRRENVAGATALHAVAGFTGRHRVEGTHSVDAGGKLPRTTAFIDAGAPV